MFLIPLFAILGFAFVFYRFFDKTPGRSIFFSISGIVVVSFLGHLINPEVISIVLNLAGVAVLFYFAVKEKDLCKNFVFSPPVVIFLIASVVFYFVSYDFHFFFWDEFSHWGPHIKETFYYNDLYHMKEFAHLMYPPGMVVWSDLFLYILDYKEGVVYFAYFVFLFGVMMPLYDTLSWKKWYWIILVLIMEMSVFATFGHWFTSIYVDHVISAMFAGIVIAYLYDNKEKLYLYILPVLALVLVKEAGLFFGAVFLGLAVLDRFINVRTKIFKDVKFLLMLGIMFISMFIILKGWQIRQESFGIKPEKQSAFYILKTVVTDKHVLKPDIEKEVKKRFLDVFLNQQINTEKLSLRFNEFSYGLMKLYKRNIKFTALGALVFILITGFVYYLLKFEDKKRIFVLNIYLIFMTLVYILILYQSYLVAFGNGALRIPSYVRYVNIGIMPLFFISFYYFVPKRKQNNTEKKLLIVFSVLLGVLIFVSRPYYKSLYVSNKSGLVLQIQKLKQSFFPVLKYDEKIMIVLPQNNMMVKNILRYEFLPAKVKIVGDKFFMKSINERIEEYKQYNYVLFLGVDKTVLRNARILKLKNQKQIYVLYKIETINNKLEIKPVK
jgi:hypothetical protein